MSNYRLEISQDLDTESPRERDNLGTMVCFHRNYLLGDKHSYQSRDFNGWDDLEKQIEKDHGPSLILPLYLFDHSGLSISTSPFSCRWDSGQIGFIFVSKENIRKEYGKKIVSKKLRETAIGYLENEVKTYDQYLTGDVYGFQLFRDDEEIDSCWGFYGSDPKTNGMMDYIPPEIFGQCEIKR